MRIVQEGTFWETGEYRFNWALENDQFNTVGLDEMWVGQNSIPVIGTVRVGHVKNAIGLEGDMTSSSRCMTFMERSSYSEAIELNQNFVTGLWFGSSYADDRITYQAVVFRPDNANSGDFFGDGQSGVQARLTCLPLYEDEGRHLLHLGISGGWRDGTNNLANANYIGNTVTLQARPELRDDDPAGSRRTARPFPTPIATAMISTGALACDNEYLMGLEMLYIRGPFSFQAEYGWNWLNNASGILARRRPHRTYHATDYMFNGGYVQVAYTLTGENRAYDKKSGCLSRYYFGNQGPYENAFLVRDEAGGLCWGRGAWEVAARYSYTDLNSGVGATAVQGGIMDGFGIALNWYVNTNLTVNTEWVWDNRYDFARQHCRYRCQHSRRRERLRNPRAVLVLTTQLNNPKLSIGENNNDKVLLTNHRTRLAVECPFLRASPHGSDGGRRNVLRQCRVRVVLQLLSTLRLQTCSRMPHLLHHQEGDHV